MKYPLKVSRVFDTIFAKQNENETILQITDDMVSFTRIQHYDLSDKKYFYHILLQEKDQLNALILLQIFKKFDLNLQLYDAVLFHLYLKSMCIQTKKNGDLKKIFADEIHRVIKNDDHDGLVVELKNYFINFKELREILFKEVNNHIKMKEIITRIYNNYQTFIANNQHLVKTTKILLNIDFYKTKSINTSKINQIFQLNGIPPADTALFLFLKFIKQDNKTLKYLIIHQQKLLTASAPLTIQKYTLKKNIIDESTLKVCSQNLYADAEKYKKDYHLQEKQKIYESILKCSNKEKSDIFLLETDLQKIMQQYTNNEQFDVFMIHLQIKNKGAYFEDVFFDFCERRVHQKPYNHILQSTICDTLFAEQYAEKSLSEIMNDLYNETFKRMTDFNFQKKKKLYDHLLKSKNTQNQILTTKINEILTSKIITDDEKKSDDDEKKSDDNNNIFLNIYLQCECNGVKFESAFKKMLTQKGNGYVLNDEHSFIHFDKLRQILFSEPDIEHTVKKIRDESQQQIKKKFNEYYEKLDTMKDIELRKKLIFWQKQLFFNSLQEEMKLTDIYTILKTKFLQKTNEQLIELSTLQCFYLLCSNNEIKDITQWILSSFSNKKTFKIIKDSKKYPAVKTDVLKKYMTQKCNADKGIVQIINSKVHYLDDVKLKLSQHLFEEIDEKQLESDASHINIEAEIIINIFNTVFKNNKIQKKNILHIDNE
eukprot:171759_1